MARYALTYWFHVDPPDAQHEARMQNELAAFGATLFSPRWWMFSREGVTAEELRKHFQTKIHANDSIVVLEVSTYSAVNPLNQPAVSS